ncbi:MAG: hypothetical protein OEZ39_06975 [Gammaproteobacteria bacterium]|nr:hypothetical protein [Gammaproteobacteria bacterium]MDH5651599.1 hypothetical protein [Gammaproteobacteria bacterium]
MSKQKQLLSIIELGGYPDFSAVYADAGYETVTVTSVRKAIQQLKKSPPQAIVAEFNFQSDFRDRTSSLESLLAVVERLPGTRVIVLYEQEFEHQFRRLCESYPIHAAVPFPIDTEQLKAALA